MKLKPVIVIQFMGDDSCTWQSPGWSWHYPLIQRATKIINYCNTALEVVDMLEGAGFCVVAIMHKGASHDRAVN